MNNLMMPLVTAMALRKKKNLSNQESMKAAMMGYVGSAMPGAAGAVLGTMSAVNEESLKNKLEASEVARVTAQSGQSQADSDWAVLKGKGNVDVAKKIVTIDYTNDEGIREVLARRGVIADGTITGATGKAGHSDKELVDLKKLIADQKKDSDKNTADLAKTLADLKKDSDKNKVDLDKQLKAILAKP